MTMQHPEYIKPLWRSAPFFVLIGMTVIAALAALWILALFGIFPAIWTSFLSVIAMVFGLLLALLQLVQRPASQSPQVETPDPQKGAICVWWDTDFCGTSIYACKGFHKKPSAPEQAAVFTEQTINGRYGIAAEFSCLEPGNYTIFDESGRMNQTVTLSPGQTVHIDRTRRA